MDAGVPAGYADHNASAEALRIAGTYSFPANAGTVCVFLCSAAFSDVRLVGQVLRHSRHGEGHRQTSIHYCGVRGICASDPIGRNLNARYDPPAWRQALAMATSLDLRERRSRRGPLLVAGEERRPRAAHL